MTTGGVGGWRAQPARDSDAWRESALCQQVDPELWFPERGGDNGVDAKRICRVCPVRDECLEYAVRNWIHYGIWGGETPESLKKIRRERGMKPPNGGHMPPAPVDKILELAVRGWTATAIASAVGCTERTVWRVLDRKAAA